MLNTIDRFRTENTTVYRMSTLRHLVKFNAWYEENWHIRFVNEVELRKCATIDVTILRRGAIKFMNTFTEHLRINPFTNAITLASALMNGFRKRFLKPNTLGITPSNQYNYGKNAAFIGRKWIAYVVMKHSREIEIEYELPRGGLVVDGYDATYNKVYEFFRLLLTRM